MIKTDELEFERFLNDRDAIFALGRYYFNQKKHSQAMYFFRAARDLKCSNAFIWLAFCFAEGYGCVRNVELAKTYGTKAVELNALDTMSADELYQLGSSLVGDSVDEFYGVGVELIEFARQRGSVSAAVDLGLYYIHPCAYDRNVDEAIRCLYPVRKESASARGGLADAYMTLGRMKIKKYADEGLYDESVLAPEYRHPRYWLDGDRLVVKYCQYSDVVRFYDGNPNFKGYWSVWGVVANWINDCLECMDPQQRKDYLESLGITDQKKIDSSHWKLIVLKDGRSFQAVQKVKYGEPELMPIGG